jgi:hypothetical protein
MPVPAEASRDSMGLLVTDPGRVGGRAVLNRASSEETAAPSGLDGAASGPRTGRTSLPFSTVIPRLRNDQGAGAERLNARAASLTTRSPKYVSVVPRCACPRRCCAKRASVSRATCSAKACRGSCG